MHTNPPESISLNKYISSNRWVIALVCIIAFSSCKPKDPIMNAAEQFYDKGLISVSDMEILRNIYEQHDSLDRRSVAFAAMGGLEHGFTMYPPIGLGLLEFEPVPGEVYTVLSENAEVLQFFIDSKFFTPTEIGYLTKKASWDKDFTYENAMRWIANIMIARGAKTPNYLPSIEDEQMDTVSPK